MKVWKKYNKRQKQKFLKKYYHSNWQIMNNILCKELKEISKKDWNILYKAGVTNGIGNFLMPEWLRTWLSVMFPFIKWQIHDLNCALGGGFREYLRAHYGIIKYGSISIIKHLSTGHFLMFTYSLIIGVPLILFSYILVMLFSWTSFNFLKLQNEQ